MSEFVTEAEFNTVKHELSAMVGEYQTLQESYEDLAFRIENIGWTRLTSLNTGGNGFTLDALGKIAEPLAELIEINPLLKRAADLRHAYVYGEGYDITNADRAKTVISRASNVNSFFGTEASLARIKSRLSDGNVFILRHKTKNDLIHIPFREITGIITDDMDTSRVLYVQRSWSDGSNRPVRKWFKTNTNDRKNYPDAQVRGGAPIDGNYVMYHRASNRQAGYALGVPDALAAMQWAEAYTEYLINNSKLVRAYARIAAQVRPDTKKGAEDAAIKVAGAGDTNTFGATAILGGTLQHLPATGSSVDFNNGRPLAATVAAVLGVSSDALLSGTVGATKSVSDMLDLATGAVMRVLQAEEKALIETILHDMGAPKAKVAFPTMGTDPVYRRIGSLAEAYATGAIFQQEYRDEVLELLDIAEPKKGLPKPDGFNTGHTPGDKVADPIPGQGNTGAIGAAKGAGNDARDNGEYEQKQI